MTGEFFLRPMLVASHKTWGLDRSGFPHLAAARHATLTMLTCDPHVRKPTAGVASLPARALPSADLAPALALADAVVTGAGTVKVSGCAWARGVLLALMGALAAALRAAETTTTASTPSGQDCGSAGVARNRRGTYCFNSSQFACASA
jgi:hypothetical protein